jgi:hypothetical protein
LHCRHSKTDFQGNIIGTCKKLIPCFKATPLSIVVAIYSLEKAIAENAHLPSICAWPPHARTAIDVKSPGCGVEFPVFISPSSEAVITYAISTYREKEENDAGTQAST